jgi:hypothetical protein
MDHCVELQSYLSVIKGNQQKYCSYFDPSLTLDITHTGSEGCQSSELNFSLKCCELCVDVSGILNSKIIFESTDFSIHFEIERVIKNSFSYFIPIIFIIASQFIIYFDEIKFLSYRIIGEYKKKSYQSHKKSVTIGLPSHAVDHTVNFKNIQTIDCDCLTKLKDGIISLHVQSCYELKFMYENILSKFASYLNISQIYNCVYGKIFNVIRRKVSARCKVCKNIRTVYTIALDL